MFIKIPFESEIEFKTNISEITKISLEHDFNVSDKVVLGNFYISGEYRIHEVSVNTDPFKYTLPFEVNLRDDIDKDTVEFNIEDFTYEIKNDNILKVNIEYSLKGEIKEVDETFERVDEDELESELSYIDDFLESEERSEEVIKENEEMPKELQEKEERLDEVDKKTIMETIKNSDDTFVTYHVHIVKESETLESICNFYGIPTSLVEEYNTLDKLNIGDKLIIPETDE